MKEGFEIYLVHKDRARIWQVFTDNFYKETNSNILIQLVKE